MATRAADLPVQDTVEGGIPDEPSWVPLQADASEKPASPPALPRPAQDESGSPTVHIGLMEVVVLAPENAPVRKESLSVARHNYASRHYLRNL